MSETAQETPTFKETISATPSEVFGDDLPPDETQGEPTTTDDKGQPTTVKGQQSPAPALTADQIRDSVREGVRSAAPAAPERQWTQAELDAHFHVWQPTEELVQRVLAGGEDGLKAFVEMREGLSKQFMRLVQLQSEVLRQELTGQVAPALSFVQEAAAAKDREAFFDYAKDLQGHEELTQTVFNALKAEGFVAKDKAEAYKVLADRTRKLMPTSTNGSGASQSAGALQQTTTQTKRPAALSSGSQAGGGGGDSAPVTGFPGGEVFL
jgi:hypothetical protein